MITKPTAAPREDSTLLVMYNKPVQLLDLTTVPEWKENVLSADNAKYYAANNLKAKRWGTVRALDVNSNKQGSFIIRETTWNKCVDQNCKDLYAAVDKVSKLVSIVLPLGTEDINAEAQRLLAEIEEKEFQLKLATAANVTQRAATLQPTGPEDLGF
jgi:hypothetical protein